MELGALLWLKIGDTIGSGPDSNTLIYRELKNGHFYGLFWNFLLGIGSVVRLDDYAYICVIFDDKDGVEFIRNNEAEYLDSFI